LGFSVKHKVLDLFSGIGGFSLGLERAGDFETVAFCEIEKYPQKVLAKHWPGVPIYEDVRELTAERLRADGIVPTVICAGFPCQDVSNAGKGAGIGEGTRSGLWSECARLLGELRPRYAIFENVTALLSGDSGRWFQRVLWDISEVGYDAEWHCIPASELGAHHHRDRVWIIAYPVSAGSGETGRGNSSRSSEEPEGIQPQNRETHSNYAGKVCENVADSSSSRSKAWMAGQEFREEGYAGVSINLSNEIRRARGESGLEWWAVEPDVGRVADGVPARSHRLKALGNAVVPQIPELIGRAIMQAQND
jgi:DNA (cytosine-5)-methyltransferase 1